MIHTALGSLGAVGRQPENRSGLAAVQTRRDSIDPTVIGGGRGRISSERDGSRDAELAGETVTRIGLIGGHPYERDLVASWLRDLPGIQSVTGVVADDPRRRPMVTDLAVVIVDEPEDRILSTCREVAGLVEGGSLVAVLRSGSARLVRRLAVAGVSSMVSMASGPATLGHAIDRAKRQGAWLDPALSPFVLLQLGGVPDNDLGLTPREFEVAQQLPLGLTRSEIAAELGVGEETVKTHVRSIYTKLGTSDRSSIARVLKDCHTHHGAAPPLVRRA